MTNPAKTRSRPDFPWWLVAIAAMGLWLGWQVLVDPYYRSAFMALMSGVGTTVVVAVVAYLGACALGMGLALMSLSSRQWLRQCARFYIEVMRAVPILVLLLYVAFALVPMLVAGASQLVESFGGEPLRTRDFPLIWRAVLALILAYSAFLAEIFRAGLQAVDQGQIEAAKALGLGRWQRLRLVIWPQAFRMMLPPLGNDFIAMIKDSSLVAVLGVNDIAQLAKLTASTNFRYLETYNVAAMLYLSLCIGLSILLRGFERRMRLRGRGQGTESTGL